jgi:hypothetical protein
MQQWWEALPVLEKIFWYIALPFSVILVIQLILTFAGLGGGATDIGTDAPDTSGFDGGHDYATDNVDSAHSGDFMPAFSIFTVRNFIAFFAVFGWAGLAFIRSDLSLFWVLILSVLMGIMAMLIVSSLFYFISKLADSGGSLNISNTLNLTGTVYLPIKANGMNIGKIQIIAQGSLRELKAMTKTETDLPTGTVVKVTEIENDELVIVEKL